MMPPYNFQAQPNSKDQNQSSENSKKALPKPPPDQTLQCPRCDSINTKFCYYNNYNLNQPRHFCKTCRRYWTKGGALRNVPIGGGCRRNKKVKSSSSEIGGLKIFNGFSPPMDFQVCNPRNLMGFNYGGNQDMGLASSIESLSYINQDLHWRLQQQRLAMLFGGEGQKEVCVSSNCAENQIERIQPILFQNLEISNSRKDDSNDDGVTEWFFGNSYAANSSNNSNGQISPSNWANELDLHHFSTLP